MKTEYGHSDGYNYVVNINGVNNNFFSYPFGRQISELNKTKIFMNDTNTKTAYVSTKNTTKNTLSCVKQWIKENKPAQVYACWKMDSSFYRDDSVSVYYTK